MHRNEALSALLEAASEQGGYVTSAQAKRLGLARDDIDRLVSSGDLHRVRRGIFRMRHASTRLEADIAAWLQLDRSRLPWERQRSPRAVVSHTSAAALRGLGTIIPGLPELTVLTGARHGSAADDLIVHRVPVDDQDWAWVEVDGVELPVTTPARTIVDLVLAREEPSYLIRAVREALQDKAMMPADLRDAARRRRRRTAGLERAVSDLLEAAA